MQGNHLHHHTLFKNVSQFTRSFLKDIHYIYQRVCCITTLGKSPGNHFPFLSAGADTESFEFQEVTKSSTHPHCDHFTVKFKYRQNS